jgi:heptaprenyl diphosphate synthase
VAEAQRVVARWAEEARAVLAPLPDGPVKDSLSALCDQVVGRTT